MGCAKSTVYAEVCERLKCLLIREVLTLSVNGEPTVELERDYDVALEDGADSANIALESGQLWEDGDTIPDSTLFDGKDEPDWEIVRLGTTFADRMNLSDRRRLEDLFHTAISALKIERTEFAQS